MTWRVAPYGFAALIGLFGFAIWLTLVSGTLVIRGARAKHHLHPELSR